MSIRLRLALWYGGLTGVIVVLLCLAIYATHVRAHYDSVDQELAGAANHVGGESDEITEDRLTTMLSAPFAPDVVVRAYGPEGRVLSGSPNVSQAPGVSPGAVLDRPSGSAFDPVAGLAPPLMSVSAGRGAFGLVEGSEGRWRVYVLPVSGAARYVVAASPLGRLDEATVRFRWTIALFGVAASVVSLVAGVLLTGQALRPVTVLNSTAGAIAGSSDFSRRVPKGDRHDELGQLAETINQMLANLEQAYLNNQRFVADASHELRAPLTAIQGNLELLERNPDVSVEERNEALGEASREAKRLAHLVADLLALARADAGVRLRFRRVELDRVLLETLATARHLSRGQNVELAALEPALIEGDDDRLKELFFILFDNALKYTPAGGQIILNLCRHGQSAEVTLRDTGVGIPPEELPHVFERFYRGDPARGRDPGGTGLGLPIARWIVLQHGGEIHLDSQPDKGTTVTVRLPLATA